MFNWGVCDSCKRSNRFNDQAIGCDLSECRYEPIPTNSSNSTTGTYTFVETTDRTKKVFEELVSNSN